MVEVYIEHKIVAVISRLESDTHIRDLERRERTRPPSEKVKHWGALGKTGECCHIFSITGAEKRIGLAKPPNTRVGQRNATFFCH